MNQRISKALHKAFPDRKEYRTMKKAYINGSPEQRILTSKVLKKMKGKTIKRMEVSGGG